MSQPGTFDSNLRDSGRRTRPRVKNALLLFALVTALGLFYFGYHYFGRLTEGGREPMRSVFIAQMTGAYAFGLLIPLMLRLVAHFPIARDNFMRRLPVYLGTAVVLSIAHTMLMWGSRSVLFPLAGLGHYDYGIMRFRFAMEFFMQFMVFAVTIGFMHFARYHRRAAQRELHAAHLEAELRRAQLENLEARLQPHFLFNTLNAISSLMYHDTAAADRMMTQLSDLLRMTLATDSTDVSLQHELGWILAYLEILRGRYGERLNFRLAAAADVQQLRVPRLLLQPLVENAIRHGVAKHAGQGTIEVSAARDNGRLCLEVRDNGPGLENGRPADTSRGVGLANTIARLKTVYGDQHSFTLENHPAGGVSARIEIPAEILHE
jgi:signal transduction histidine kinase